MFEPEDKGEVRLRSGVGVVIRIDTVNENMTRTVESRGAPELALQRMLIEISAHPNAYWIAYLYCVVEPLFGDPPRPDRSDPLGQRPTGTAPVLIVQLERHKGNAEWHVQYPADDYKKLHSPSEMVDAIKTYFARWMVEGAAQS